jgi:hypothetical protein
MNKSNTQDPTTVAKSEVLTAQTIVTSTIASVPAAILLIVRTTAIH